MKKSFAESFVQAIGILAGLMVGGFVLTIAMTLLVMLYFFLAVAK